MNIEEHAAKVTSQAGEDGAIEYVFSLIGETDKTAVEFGAFNAPGDNTLNLKGVNWRRVLFGTRDHVEIIPTMITPENINDEFRTRGVLPNFDLLSIDIDSADYWVWEALEFRPRVVIIEHNLTQPLTRACTVAKDAECSGTYYGASALALRRLGRRKGYSLAWCSGHLNLMFIRSDIYNPPEKPLSEIVGDVDIPAFCNRWNTSLPSWYGMDDGGREWVDIPALTDEEEAARKKIFLDVYG